MCEKVVLLGIGERRTAGAPELRTFAAKAARLAQRRAGEVPGHPRWPAGLEGELRAVGEGLELGAYRFTK